MCKTQENSRDITNESGVENRKCGGTCPAFKKHGQCPRVLKELKKQKAEMTAQADVTVADVQITAIRAATAATIAASVLSNS